MADTILLDKNYESGMNRDLARDQLPRGTAFNMVDWIPDVEASLRMRGGWTWASRDFAGLSPTAGWMSSLGWAPFPLGAECLLYVTSNGQLFKSNPAQAIDGNAGISVGACRRPTCGPFWHSSRMILPVASDESVYDPQSYDGTTLASIGGSPPRCVDGCSWGDYLLLANGWDPASAYVARPNRIWWSNVGDINTWQTGASGAFWDMPYAVVKAVLMRNNITLVLGFDQTQVLAGDIPPPGGNLQRRYLFDIGCIDPRSVVTYQDNVIWANTTGVWRTDAVSAYDITDKCGAKQYWQDICQLGIPTGAGLFYDHYIVAIRSLAGANIDTLAFDLKNNRFFRLSNIGCFQFARRAARYQTAGEPGYEELFGAAAGSARAIRLSPLWSPSGTGVDANGLAIQPLLESRYYIVGSTGRKRLGGVWIGHELLSAGGSPQLRVGFADSPEETTYEQAPRVLPMNTQFLRKRIPIRRKLLGLSLQIQQVGASADTRLGGLEADGYALEETR